MAKQTKDVFISYRREDNIGVAREIQKALELRGYSVYRDRDDISPGEAYPDNIRNAIDNAYDFIIVVSRSYFGSGDDGKCRILDRNDWCHQELKRALQRKIRIIPVVLDAAFFRIRSEGLGPAEEKALNEFRPVFEINYLEYSRSENVNDFTDRLISFLSEESTYHSRCNYFRNALQDISRNGDPATVNVDIRKLVLPLDEKTVKQFIRPLLKESEPLTLQFWAYYALFTFYRRLGYQTKTLDLVKKYGSRFDDREYPFNNVVKSQYYLYLFNKSDSDEQYLDQAICYADLAGDLLPSNSGVLVTYAELIAIACGTDEDKYDGHIQKAVEAIRKAMDLNPQYPKHSYVLGLLESARGNYTEGIKNINTAIDLENSESKDAFLRIIKYYDAIHDIKLKMLKEEILGILDRRV